MPPFEKHIFICTNRRDAADLRGCCAQKGSEEIREFFKKEIKRRGLKSKMRANTAGCLDHCAQGPTVVIYPEGVWYRVANLTDAMEVFDKHIEKGEIIQRLLLHPAPPFEGSK